MRSLLLGLLLTAVFLVGIMLPRWPGSSSQAGSNHPWPTSEGGEPVPIYWNSFEVAAGCTTHNDIGKQQDGTAAPGTLTCVGSPDPDKTGIANTPDGTEVFWLDSTGIAQSVVLRETYPARTTGEFWLRFRVRKTTGDFEQVGGGIEFMVAGNVKGNIRFQAVNGSEEMSFRCAPDQEVGDPVLMTDDAWYTGTIHVFDDGGGKWDINVTLHDENGLVVLPKTFGNDCANVTDQYDGIFLFALANWEVPDLYFDCIELYEQDPGAPGTPDQRCREPL